MAITTVAVSVHVDDTNGVLVGAKVNAKLNRVEVYQGHIVPEFTTATTDANGDATLNLWPNALGVTESSYEITIIDPNSRHVASFLATIPNSACNLWDVANLPAYPGKSDSQRAADAALVSETAAAASEAVVVSLYDSFDDRYLGAKASAPTLDNDGNALLIGAMYFNSTTDIMYAWSGTAWGATFATATSIIDNGNATAITIGSDESSTFAGDVINNGAVTNNSTVVDKIGTDVASATALTLGVGNYFDITGSATITSIGTKGVGTCIVLQFDGILSLTHHATDLILPSAANITTAAGDIVVFYEYATGDWRCTSYTRANGLPVIVNIQNDASDGASMVLLSTQTASASATVDFTTNIDGTYDKYIIKITNFDAVTNGTDLYMRLSQSGTFITGTSYYGSRDDIVHGGTSAITGMSAAGQFTLCNSLDTSNARSALNATIEFSAPDNTTYSKHFMGDIIYESSAGNFIQGRFGGIHLDTTAMDGVRFLMSSGNISSGVFRLYGIKDS